MVWNYEPPQASSQKDREVENIGNHLVGKRIALMITGSISAYRCPDLVRDLRREGAEVQVYATREGLRYVSKEALEWCSLNPVIDHFSPEAEHLSDQNPLDAFLVAPASYSVINKAAMGMADSVVTSTLASAFGRCEREGIPVLFAPAMHGNMHNTILTESLKRLSDIGAVVIPPRQTHGKNNLASSETIVAETIRSLSQSPLKGCRMIVTGGPTPVPLDRIRVITTKFSGGLSIEISKEAWFRGADVRLLLGRGSLQPPTFLETLEIDDFNQYQQLLLNQIEKQQTDWGIFTAAVADYEPESVFDGKWQSLDQEKRLKLVPTPKVIEEVKKRFPRINQVPFKYEEGVSHQELMKIAQGRLESGSHRILVANRGDEFLENGEQVAWILSPDIEPQRVIGKKQIASALLDRIETFT
ncbi:MAG: bifunctional phosphopantothenoylcysteine decarboxylase/phosphopantothenate--cysteine ligase CoaBC [SAR324 cluster bacterium]|nr:bifunctional phosphopantothenoylcysteine decarboxylase/phosphopantothenate--cysteine ligase CoaBC [SAR324 cluster bacterium]